MFGKKKESGMSVMHYEGIEGFATDYPCKIEIKGEKNQAGNHGYTSNEQNQIIFSNGRRKVHVEVSRSGKKHIQDEGCQKVLLDCGL